MEAKQLTYDEYKAAYETAHHQYRNHQDMVSGRWSIDGKEFCEKYHLDYDQARDYEMMNLDNDFEGYYVIEERKITKKIGKLTVNQEHWLIDTLEETFDWEEEQSYFWYDLATNQLADAYPEYNERYYEDKDLKD